MKMPYYHVYIEYETKKGKKTRRGFAYNLKKEEVTQRFASPYIENRDILFSGQFIQPNDIDMIEIFESEKCFHELILPNGKSPIDEENNDYICRCFCDHKVKASVRLRTHDFIISPPEEKKELGLMESASFLGLDTNWYQATCALQLQEVAVTLVAKRKGIRLDKTNVEGVLNKKIDELSFNERYEAFSRRVKDSFGIELPILTTDLRRMRTRVLHKGYNPKPEETESIISFTIGLLKRLEACMPLSIP